MTVMLLLGVAQQALVVEFVVKDMKSYAEDRRNNIVASENIDNS
jgi:hypothetical protein